MCGCKVVTTPLSTFEKSYVSEGEPLVDPDATRYMSIVGALQYDTLNWTYISLC
jgi:hypothetical protein